MTSPLDWAELAGDYEFVLVATSGVERPTPGTGYMTLWPTDSLHRKHPYLPAEHTLYPLYGALDSAFLWPTSASVPVPPSSRDPDLPGVQFKFNTARGTLTFLIGAPDSPKVAFTDSGVLFDVYSLSSSVMTGRWVDGGIAYGIRSPDADYGKPAGYFCLRKIDSASRTGER